MKIPKKLSDTYMWCRVSDARKYHSQSELSNKLWSMNVAQAVELHFDIFDIISFCELTQKDSLPVISAKAAVILLEQEQRLRLNETANEELDLTCLQKRCIDALFDDENGYWKVENPRTLLQDKLKNVPRCVLESLILRTMDSNKHPNSSCPSFVEVSGAGTELVNGVYVKSELHNGYPTFTRSGTYMLEDKTFCISRETDEYYYISVILDGTHLNGPKGEIDLYRSVFNEGELIPNNQWEKLNGKEPLPILKSVSL